MTSETGTLDGRRNTNDGEAGLELQFGAYRIMRLLGEGGMGTVYLAEQQHPIRRQVALKVIKLGMSRTEEMARFDSERQALALMDHPNIARVYDAGASEQGRPYFVMEYVSGIAVTAYCDLHRLNNRERLELFVEVCQAVHHAHQRGIIHRDIKPSNVLVGEHDGKPFPKVIDFGIAKAIDKRVLEQATFTEMGNLLGTPEYMSPEQTLLSSDIDTTTDVYSLGVLLYELLSGALPFEGKRLREAGLAEFQRIIREEDPPTPSDKASQLEDTTGVAERRRTNPASLRRQLSGDLTWILMKALEKDRQRRYSSVSELAADIRRHLDNHPVLAGPPNWVYRAQKFVRRHRLVVSAGMLITTSLIAGMISTAWEAHVAFLERNRADAGMVQARRERSRADEEAAQAREERGRSEAHAREAETQRKRADTQRHEAMQQRLAAQRQSYSANLVAADLHLGSNDVVEARTRLLMCPRDQRSWEWDHLFLKTDSSLATLYPIFNIDDTDNGTASFAFSEARDRIFWYTKHTLQSWDAATYLPVARFSGFGTILAISIHAKRIIARPSSRTARPDVPKAESDLARALALARASLRDVKPDVPLAVFDPVSGKRISLLAGSGRASQVVFAPDETHAAGVSPDGMLIVWNTDSGKVITTIPIPGQHISFTVFSPNSARIASGFDRDSVKMWDVQSARLLSTLGGQTRSATSGAFSPDNLRLLIGTFSGSVGSWDVGSGENVLSIPENHGAISSVAYSPDGNWILAGARDNIVRIWKTDTGTLVSSLIGHENPVTSIAFTPDGSKILTGQVQTMLPGYITPKARVWDARHCCAGETLAGHQKAVNAVVFSSDQRMVASASDDETVRLWDTSSGKTLRVLTGHTGAVLALAFSPDGTLLASGSADQSIRIWNVAGGELVQTVRAHAGDVTSLAFDLHGARLVSGSKDKTMRVWRLPTGNLITTITSGAPVNSVALSPDGSHIVSGGGGTILRGEPPLQVWDVSSGAALTTMTSQDLNGPPAMRADYSPDGSHIISGDAALGRAARVWNVGTGELVRTLRGPTLSTTAFPFGNIQHGFVTYQPDGRRILATWGPTVQIWDAESYEPLMALRGRTDSRCLAFSKSGRFLASGFQDGTVNIWDTRSAYNPEAEALVESLFSKLIFAKEVLAQLRNDNNTDKILRADAIRLVLERGEISPYLHQLAGLRVAMSPKHNVGDYRLALRRSQLA